MEERQETLSKSSYGKIYEDKIRKTFHFNLPKDEYEAEQVYHALVKEQQLYLYYAVAASVLCSAFWDFGDSTSRVVHLIKEWENCTLKCDNYESFTRLMDDFTRKEGKKESLAELRANFSLLFADPNQLDKDMRCEMLIFLCRINAFHALRLFLKLHSPRIEVNFPSLLREAIGCLHAESVKTLVNAGADVRGYFGTSAYQDYGVYVFMPTFYYAVWLPCDNFCTLQRDQPKILWDNPKLQNMIKTLLSLGADPEQNCLEAPRCNMDKKETKENAITLARSIIKGHKKKPNLSEESLTFLDYIMKLKQKNGLNINQEKVEKNTLCKDFAM